MSRGNNSVASSAEWLGVKEHPCNVCSHTHVVLSIIPMLSIQALLLRTSACGCLGSTQRISTHDF